MIFDQPTGISNYALNVARNLSALNPLLLTSKQQENFSCYPIPSKMTPAEGSKGHFRRLLWTQWQLPQIYKQVKADLIYSPIPEAPLYTKSRYVVMCHDLIPLRFPNLFSPLTNYFRLVVPLVLQQAEHIICNSEATAQDIHNFYDISLKKITPILLAYDANHFYPRQKIEAKQPYFLYLGRHDPYKNIQGLIAAFASLKNKQNYQLWIAGSPDQRFTPQLKQQIQELEIQEQVKFIDYVSYQELPIVISNAITLVSPSFWEGFGLTVLEAMACGTPVITSNLASLPEVVGNGAILINPKNQLEIADAMTEIAENSITRSRYTELSLQRAKLFSWQKTGQATQEVLQQFI